MTIAGHTLTGVAGLAGKSWRMDTVRSRIMVSRSVGLAIFALSLVLAVFAPSEGTAQESSPHEAIAVPNPATNLWRDVRSRAEGAPQNPELREIRAAAFARELWGDVRAGNVVFLHFSFGRFAVAGAEPDTGLCAGGSGFFGRGAATCSPGL